MSNGASPFKVGETYKTVEGRKVRITAEEIHGDCECVVGDDRIWRYNGSGNRGMVTASNFGRDDKRNLVPVPFASPPPKPDDKIDAADPRIEGG